MKSPRKIVPATSRSRSFRLSPVSRSNKRSSLRSLSKELPVADVRELTLSNGLRIVSEHIPGAASVAVGTWIGAGSRDERENEYGLAHFIEHVTFKGTANYSMKEIMQLVEARGGSLNAFTTKEQTCYYAWVRTAYLEDAVSMTADLALRPKITEASVQKEKGVIIEEIHGLDDEPDELVFDLFESTILAGNGLAHPVIGTEKSVASAGRTELRSFFNRYYAPNNITLIASGSHSHNDLFRLAKKYFGQSESRTIEYQREPFLPEASKGKRIRQSREGIGQAHLIVGRTSLGMTDERLPALGLLVTLLGVGMSSRLNLRLREELALAYDTSAFHSPFAEIGAAGIYAAVTVENAKKAEAEIRKVLRGLFSKPITETELERTKEQVIGSLILGLESTTARLMRAGQQVYYFQQYEEVESEIRKILKVNRRAITELAEELFGDETLLSVVSVASKS